MPNVVIPCVHWSPLSSVSGSCAAGYYSNPTHGVCLNSCKLGANPPPKKVKLEPRAPTHEALRRAAICAACPNVRGITLQHDPPIHTVKCAACGCGGVSLDSGSCPDRKWSRATRYVEIGCSLPPGDVMMLTAAVRDLHAAYPGKFRTALATNHPALWANNPLAESTDTFESYTKIEASYTEAIQQSNQRPYHFINGYADDLADKLGVARYPIREFRGDIRLSDQERRSWPAALGDWRGPYWLVYAGGKYDITSKWWSPDSYQSVADDLKGRVQFVQVGAAGDFHNRIDGAIDLTGKTSLRELIHLTHHASGVLCPVTVGMHLAAAVPSVDADRPRPCVVIAGGREPRHWESYPGHAYLDNVGQLSCSDKGACWKTRCQTIGDGDDKDNHNRCTNPVAVALRSPVDVAGVKLAVLDVARCMTMIEPRDVAYVIELFEAR